MQRSGVTLQRSLEHYFGSDTGTLSKSPSRSKTILIEIGPVGRPRKAPPASDMAAEVRSWWITPPLTPSLQVRTLQRISPQLRSVFIGCLQREKQTGNMSFQLQRAAPI